MLLKLKFYNFLNKFKYSSEFDKLLFFEGKLNLSQKSRKISQLLTEYVQSFLNSKNELNI